MRRFGVLVVAVSLLPTPVAAGVAGCPLFPRDNVWHADVRRLPVHPRSDAWLASMDAGSTNLHPDFGPSGGPMPYGIPYEVVAGGHPKVSIDFLYEDESDAGPYPFDEDTPIEMGSDAHAIMLDEDACVLYELFDADHNGGSPTAGSGAIFDLRSNALRPSGWTSADAAGLPILAGLVRRDEVLAGRIDHALRVTASRTRRAFLWPARHHAGSTDDPNVPPMGARFRLKGSYSLDGLRPDTKVILRAMKVHGLIVADNGSDWYVTGTAEDGWPNAMLDELKDVPAWAFEAVDVSGISVSANSGKVRTRIRIDRVVANPPGNDVDGEVIVIENRGTNARDISGWKIRDAAGHTYTFGPTVLQPRATVRVHTGSGSDTKTHRYWGRSRPVWDNDGDVAKLLNRARARHDRCRIPPGARATNC